MPKKFSWKSCPQFVDYIKYIIDQNPDSSARDIKDLVTDTLTWKTLDLQPSKETLYQKVSLLKKEKEKNFQKESRFINFMNGFSIFDRKTSTYHLILAFNNECKETTCQVWYKMNDDLGCSQNIKLPITSEPFRLYVPLCIEPIENEEERPNKIKTFKSKHMIKIINVQDLNIQYMEPISPIEVVPFSGKKFL